MNKITLYYLAETATSRCVLLTGAALNIEFNLIKMDETIGEQLYEELGKIHPVLLVPLIKDGELTLWESRAITIYLADKYDKRMMFNLYPSDPEIRAIIHQRLYFDLGILGHSFANYYYPVLHNKNENFNPTQYKKIEEAFSTFNTILEWQDKLGEENLYSAADWLTIADLSLAATVSTFIVCGFQIEAYPFVEKWYNTVRKVPYFEKANIEPLEQFRDFFHKTVFASSPS